MRLAGDVLDGVAGDKARQRTSLDRQGNESGRTQIEGGRTHWFAEVEKKVGARSDHAVIETWVKTPTRMLTENQPRTVTNVVLQYIQHYTEQ